MTEVTTEQKVQPPTVDQYGTQTSPGGYGVAVSSESGLSSGQIAGTVNGQLVERPKDVPVGLPYTPEKVIGNLRGGSGIRYQSQTDMRTGRVISEEFTDSRYMPGLITIRQDLPQQYPNLNIAPQPNIFNYAQPDHGTNLRNAMPQDLIPSNLTRDIYYGGQRLAGNIRNYNSGIFSNSTDYPELRGTPAYRGVKFVSELALESTARTVEFIGSVPATWEMMGQVVKKHPEAIIPMVTVGAYEFGSGIVKQAKENPAQLVSDVVISYGIFKGIGKGVEYGKQIPEMGGEIYSRANLRGYIPERVNTVFSGVKTDVSLAKSDISAMVSRNPIKAPESLVASQVEKFNAIEAVGRNLQNTPAPKIEPVDFSNLKSLSGDKAAGFEVEAYLKRITPREDAVIGGSTAARAQLPGARAPGDVDLTVRNPARVAKETEQLLTGLYGKENVRLEHQRFGGVEIFGVKMGGVDQYAVGRRISGEWHHVFDIHEIEPTGSIIERTGFKVQPPVEIGGLKYKSFGELLVRKIDSAVHEQPGGRINPQPHRIQKDLYDLNQFVKSAIDVKKARAEQSLPGLKQIRQIQISQVEKSFGQYQMLASFGYEPFAYGAKKVFEVPDIYKSPLLFGVAHGSRSYTQPKINKKTAYPQPVVTRGQYPQNYPAPTKTNYPRGNYPTTPKYPYPKNPGYSNYLKYPTNPRYPKYPKPPTAKSPEPPTTPKKFKLRQPTNLRIGRIKHRKLSFGKFPELARVASPQQVMKGFGRMPKI